MLTSTQFNVTSTHNFHMMLYGTQEQFNNDLHAVLLITVPLINKLTILQPQTDIYIYMSNDSD